MIVGITMTFDKGSLSRAVAGVSITRGLFMQAMITLPSDADANSYNIYYKQSGDQDYTNAVRNISPNAHTYLVSYLKKGVTYQYTVAEVINGKEVSFTPIQEITNLKPM